MNYREIKEKRVLSLVYISRQLIAARMIDGGNYVLNADMLSSVVEHYVQDLANLKSRYGISGKANSAKVAGLMAAAIMRYRPLLPVSGRASVVDNDGNETLAIYHGLAICSIQSDGTINYKEIKRFANHPGFEEWLDRFKYLLGNRNYTPENLVFVFDTIGNFVFSEVDLEKSGD